MSPHVPTGDILNAATLTDVLADFARRGDKDAILVSRDDGFDSALFSDIADQAQRLATGLIAAGVQPEEPIAIWAPNGVEWVIAYFGIIAAGATAVPLDPIAGDSEIAAMLSASSCRRIFTTRARLGRLPPRGGDASLVVYALDAARDLPADVMSWKGLLAERAGFLPRIKPGQYASLLFTSGTTGTPKAVPLTHANLIANLKGLMAARIADADDRVLLPLPLHHTYPFTVGLLGTLASGATLVLPAGMTGPQILQAIRTSRATIMIGVPGLYSALLNAIEARVARRGAWLARTFAGLRALSIGLQRVTGLRLGRLLFRRLHTEFGGALRVLSSGGAKLDPDVAWKLEGLGWRVLSGYGLTETAPILTFNPPGRSRLDSEGLPIAGVELRVEPGADGTSGEILARGPSIFAGYLNNPAATATAFTESGWFRTGDLGSVDAGGYLHVLGRVNETLVLPDGKKLFPEDVEAAYAGLPFVKEMAVLLHENALVALIVPEADAIRQRGAVRLDSLLREAIEQRVTQLNPHRRVTGYAISWQPLPRTHLGKIKRHKLPALYRAAMSGGEAEPSATVSDADRTLLGQPGARAIWDWLSARFPGRHLTLDTSPQLDLGVDSLRWIELTMEMQDRFGVQLSESAIARVMVLRDLLNEVGLASASAPEPLRKTATPDLGRLARPGLGHTVLGLVLYAVNRFVLRVLFRLRSRWESQIPSDGGLVFTPNHSSYLDPLALAAAFDLRDLRRTHWAGWTGVLFRGPIMRAISRAANVLPIDPDRDPGTALDLARSVLRMERRLVWFPEGRRSPTGEIMTFLPGVGLLLNETGAKAVPVRISGTYAAWPRTRRWPRLRRLSIVFGRPVAAAELAQRGQGPDINTRIANALRDAVAGLPEMSTAPQDRRP
jgi:long-chain acyl-CoA synthetase